MKPSREQIEFWLRELRTPELLMELTEMHPRIGRRLESTRPAIAAAITCERTACLLRWRRKSVRRGVRIANFGNLSSSRSNNSAVSEVQAAKPDHCQPRFGDQKL